MSAKNQNMKRSKFILLFGGIAAAIFIGCTSYGNVKSNETVSMRMMSYNVRHCCGKDRKVDIPRVVDAILREKPDFVGLQELDCRSPRRSNGIDQPAELGRLTGMHSTFAAGVKYRNNGGYGIAVLSKEKPLSVVRIPLPGKEPRVLLLCEFKDLWFGTTHLALQAINQMKSVEIIRKVLNERSSQKPVFLTGDWNAFPQSNVLIEFKTFMKILSKEKCRTFHGFRQYKPGSERCIDYVAVTLPSAANFEVKNSYVIENTVASDHFPVVVDVSKK